MSDPIAQLVELVDLSHHFDNHVPVYPGDPPFRCVQHCTVPRDGYSVHELDISSHAGTHIDAPSHFFADLPSIDQLPLDAFIRPVLVIDVSHKPARQRISWHDVQPYQDQVKDGMAVFFCTGWSRFWTDADGRYFDHPWIEKDVAERLIALGVKVLGTDTMSPDQSPVVGDRGEGREVEDTGYGVHEAVLGAGLIIAENLTNLGALKSLQDAGGAPQSAWMVNLTPLKITGCDGSPVRAFAWKARF
ncbi:putative cyclase [Artomyces pyxidatus]|uniref:Cyclase n=1 Tax=Artomyces pyxidatus TaxID=48021 RepID=A0ACB8SVU1_9AGAM|nr:putative cyclase [Artomyces pyxidatus]